MDVLKRLGYYYFIQLQYKDKHRANIDRVVKQNLAGADPGFPREGTNSKVGHQSIIRINFSENCMKMKKNGPTGGWHVKKFIM